MAWKPAENACPLNAAHLEKQGRIAIRIFPIEKLREFCARVFRAAKRAPGTKGPLAPGDPEREAEQVQREEGVPLILPVAEALREISPKPGIPLE